MKKLTLEQELYTEKGRSHYLKRTYSLPPTAITLIEETANVTGEDRSLVVLRALRHYFTREISKESPKYTDRNTTYS